MTRADSAASGDRLLHASPGRLLVLSHDPDSGRAELHKVLLAGSMLQAEREVAFARQFAGLAVTEYLGVTADPGTGRPRIRMRHHGGRDLEAECAEQGPLGVVVAATVLAQVADTLAAMHARGAIHGDVKPANILWDGKEARLIDLEHGTRIGEPFAGGTEGFRAPEADGRRAAGPALDAFALGRTLHWLLVTQEPSVEAHELLAATPAGLQHLLAGLEGPAAARPGLDDVAARLRAIAAAGADEAIERFETLRRGADTMPEVLNGAAGGEPAEALAACAAALRHHPADPRLLRLRAELRQSVADSIPLLVQQCHRLVRGDEFAAAGQLLDRARAGLQAALAGPGPLVVALDSDDRLAGSLRLQPLQFLDQQRASIAAAAREQQALLADMHRAEAKFDAAGTLAALDAIVARYGGTSPLVTQQRDRLHRFEFYLERMLRSAGAVARLQHAVPDTDLAALIRLLADCERAIGRRERAGGIGLRNLQLTIADLADEFPHLRPALSPALTALENALSRSTDQAWQLIGELQQKLQIVPVPVKPLQNLLARLDNLRVLEALTDRPQHPRTLLLDRIENLRLKFEQARAARDQLARGAEQAFARGHWTTGLFEMERAIASMDASGGPDGEADVEDEREQWLRERLAEAQQRKTDLEKRMQRNLQLAARYQQLLDEPDSSAAARLQVLRERRDSLQFMALHSNREQATLYSLDLREVETLITQEEAGEAETRHDRCEHPAERLHLAREVLSRLNSAVAASDPGVERSGRLLRLLDHWQQLAQNAQRDIDRIRDAAAAQQRRRVRRRTVVGTFGAAMLALAMWWWPRSRDVGAGELSAVPVTELLADRTRTLPNLQAQAGRLPAVRRAPAQALLEQVRGAVDAAALHAALLQFATPPLPARSGQERAFANECWRVGLLLLADQAPSRVDELLAAADAAAPELGRAGVQLPPITVAELQELAKR